MRRLAVTSVLMLVFAACNEQFPRRLDELGEGIDSPADAASTPPTTADGSLLDAGADAETDVVTDGAASADTGAPIVNDAGVCNVRLASFTIASAAHVPQGTAVEYSNPPAGGPHFPTWANFDEFDTVVPDGNLVHSMEHGAVLLLYNCNTADPACTKIVSDLRAVRNAIPDDPQCASFPPLRVRIILAPRPTNDTAVAAAAWGQTYRADCVDAASLTKFITDHYAKASEDFCNPGQTAF